MGWARKIGQVAFSTGASSTWEDNYQDLEEYKSTWTLHCAVLLMANYKSKEKLKRKRKTQQERSLTVGAQARFEKLESIRFAWTEV